MRHQTSHGFRLSKNKTNNSDDPEVLAVIPLPTAQERRRREIMLARVMLVAIDVILAGEPLGELQLAGVLEVAAARLRSGQGWDEGTKGDVLREILRVYQEHVRGCSDSC
jgi:hypothetical protein